MTLFAIIGFYSLFFAVGAFAGRMAKSNETDEWLLAGRRMPVWLGTCSLIATWVGGGYINGTAEAVYDSQLGMLWTQAPWAFAMSLVLGGLIFVIPMRRQGFTTMLDLFDRRYGPRVAALLYLPALLGELFWMAAILAALGGAFGTVLGLDVELSIVLSAVIALSYTLIGGLWSVALTDGLQLTCIALGLCLALPFAMDYVGGWEYVWSQYQASHAETARWFPSRAMMRTDAGWQWLDTALLLVLGGIPWQVYFQRVLACPTDRVAVRLSVIAGAGCLLMAIPSVLIGMIGNAADWSLVTGAAPDPPLVLPYVLRYLTPPWIATLGLCAVAAAVMSSVDSSMLSAASMFAWNVYRPWRPHASDVHVRRAMRFALVVVASAAAMLAVTVQSVYQLWYLSADLVYVILFPQLVMALFLRRAHAIGAVVGAFVGLVLRLLICEPSPLRLPFLDDAYPLLGRTIAMVGSLSTIAAVSWIVERRLARRDDR